MLDKNGVRYNLPTTEQLKTRQERAERREMMKILIAAVAFAVAVAVICLI